jgi:hypothetical protein
MNTLKLTLKKHWFDIMITGEKNIEYRLVSGWIASRLLDKNGKHRQYDRIRFTNGYGNDKPWFECEFKGFDYSQKGVTAGHFSNGMKVVTKEPTYCIFLGKVLDSGNLKNP